jgi:hypothetical protein
MIGEEEEGVTGQEEGDNNEQWSLNKEKEKVRCVTSAYSLDTQLNNAQIN